MSSIDYDNLRKIIDKCKGFLRDDYLEAMEAAAVEIERLQEVVIRLQQEMRALKARR